MTKQEVIEHLEHLSIEAKRIALDDAAIDAEFQTLIADWEEFKTRFKADPLFDKEILDELIRIEKGCKMEQVQDRTQLLNFLSVLSSLASAAKQYRNKKRKQTLMHFSTETSSSAFNLKMGNIFK